MKRTLQALAFAICFSIAAYAPADGLLLLAGSSGGEVEAPDGTTILPIGKTSATQTVIPRYRTGSTFPSGQVIGWGPGSVLMGTAETDEAIVITEDYGESLSQWQTTSVGTEAAILQPRLVDCTITGYSADDWLDNNSPNTVNSNPSAWDEELGDSYAGALLAGSGISIDNVNIKGIPGTALKYARPESSLVNGPRIHDQLQCWANRIFVNRVFRGVWANATDGTLTNCYVSWYRDYGIRIGAGAESLEGDYGGAIQFSNLHTSSGGLSIVDNSALADDFPGTEIDDMDGLPGCGIWLAGDLSNGNNIYPEGAPVGLLCTGSYNTVNGGYIQLNWLSGIWFSGTDNKVSQQIIKCNSSSLDGSSSGVVFKSQRNTLSDSKIILSAGSGYGIVMESGTYNTVRNVQITSVSGASGVYIPTGVTLYNCTIDVLVQGGGTGITFAGTAAINAGNVIRVNTASVSAAADLPDNWTTTPNTTTTSQVFINGVQYFYNP